MRMAAEYGQALMKQNGSLQKQLSASQADYQALKTKQSSTDDGQRRITSLSKEIMNLEEANKDRSDRVDSLEIELQKTLEAGRANVTELSERQVLIDQGRGNAKELAGTIEELEVLFNRVI
jgi:predicted nuclease with TOPRIM domain